jgi:hypothetical protein
MSVPTMFIGGKADGVLIVVQDGTKWIEVPTMPSLEWREDLTIPPITVTIYEKETIEHAGKKYTVFVAQDGDTRNVVERLLARYSNSSPDPRR